MRYTGRMSALNKCAQARAHIDAVRARESGNDSVCEYRSVFAL